MKIDGRTVYIHNRTVIKIAEGRTQDDVMKALKDAGFTAYVSEGYNVVSVNSLLAELTGEKGEGLPKEFEGVIEANKLYKVRTRRS